MKKQDLINFTKEVVSEWEKGETFGPVHLSGGNEEQLIKIFKNIKKRDWVFSTHRSHYHALLKSKDKKWLINEIIVKANSSHINSSKHKIFTSAIVGGNIPIALGVAMALKRKKSKSKVWCFVGDMASEMGCFKEAFQYAYGHDLPIIFVIEDNEIGCETPTKEAWGYRFKIWDLMKVINYQYVRHLPHCGTGKWLKFKKFKSTGDYNAYK